MANPKIVKDTIVNDQAVTVEGGGDLSQQAWERKQTGLDDEGAPSIGTIEFDEATLEKIRTKKINGKEL